MIDLGRLDAHAFVKMQNPAALALASRMRFEKKARIDLVRDFFLSLAVTPMSRSERELVAGFFSAYRRLDSQEALQLHRELAIVKPEGLREKAMQLTNPFIELGIQKGIAQGIEQGISQGIEKGIEQGRHKGEVDVVLRLLVRRLGTLPLSQKKRIEKLDLPKIEALAESLLDFNSRTDLTRWLKQNAS